MYLQSKFIKGLLTLIFKLTVLNVVTHSLDEDNKWPCSVFLNVVEQQILFKI